MRPIFNVATAIAVLFGITSVVSAQKFPTKPIRLVVGFSAGGGVDKSARFIGKHLSEVIGQSIIVENRSGASGNIGAQLVAQATPNGYTLLMANATLAMPGLFKNLPFNAAKDLEPVSLIAIGPSVLVAHPSMPIKRLKDMISLAKARPKGLLYGSGGVGNITHLEMVLLNALTGTQMVHVPYKGSAPSIVGLLTGEVYVLFTSIPAALGQVRAGRMRPIAVSTKTRSSALPDVPTVDESGVPGYDAASWYFVFAPAGTPRSNIEMLSKEIVKIVNSPKIKAILVGDGFEPAGYTPGESARFFQEEMKKWANVIRTAGLKTK
ncbi:MAG: tripartite tricarboxylate transporter substrate binding protein [Gammaproteobacteria bacterium]|nr:tripartite tricarboxylate transporter substrate binding protein [Gammaproteobacteria bacterium]